LSKAHWVIVSVRQYRFR